MAIPTAPLPFLTKYLTSALCVIPAQAGIHLPAAGRVVYISHARTAGMTPKAAANRSTRAIKRLVQQVEVNPPGVEAAPGGE